MNIDIDELMKNSYVISILSDTQRMNTFIQTFKSAGFNLLPKIFYGLELKNKKQYGAIFNSNVMLCCISHYSLISFAYSIQMPFICIFENDAIPCKHCAHILTNILHTIPDDTDVLKLGWTAIRNQPTIINNNFLIDACTWGSHAYIVFNKYYQKALKTYTNDAGCDCLVLNDFKNAKILTTAKNLFIQFDVREYKNSLHGKRDLKYLNRLNINLNDYCLNS